MGFLMSFISLYSFFPSLLESFLSLLVAEVFAQVAILHNAVIVAANKRQMTNQKKKTRKNLSLHSVGH